MDLRGRKPVQNASEGPPAGPSGPKSALYIALHLQGQAWGGDAAKTGHPGGTEVSFEGEPLEAVLPGTNDRNNAAAAVVGWN